MDDREFMDLLKVRINFNAGEAYIINEIKRLYRENFGGRPISTAYAWRLLERLDRMMQGFKAVRVERGYRY